MIGYRSLKSRHQVTENVFCVPMEKSYRAEEKCNIGLGMASVQGKASKVRLSRSQKVTGLGLSM